MAMVSIPHFKETVIMSFKCDYCGFKSNEIKCGGAIPHHGTRFTLLMKREEDLSRDILKSDTCSVRIPEIDFEMSEGYMMITKGLWVRLLLYKHLVEIAIEYLPFDKPPLFLI